MKRFSAKQVAMLVCLIAVGIALLPLAGKAVSGTSEALVSIVDRTNPDRSAHVARSGTLEVDSRAGVLRGGFNVHGGRISTGFTRLATAPSHEGLAITDVTMYGGASAPGELITVELEAHSGAAANCTGGTIHTLRRVSVDTQDTLALNFNGPPLFTPTAPTGKEVCFGFRVVGLPNGGEISVGATGYRFRP